MELALLEVWLQNRQRSFTNLHVEFNCIKVTIQDPCAWYNDICGVARSAENKEDFLVQLKQ